MSFRNGPWKINESTRKYKNDFLEVCEDQVIRPDGKPGTYATVSLKAGVCILAHGEDDLIYLTRQFRYALGSESLEVVSGAIDEGEEPESAARRELREELGIEASGLFSLGRAHLDTSTLKAPVDFFIAQGLTFNEPQPEGTEWISMEKLKFDEAIGAVMDGTIVHVASCLLILKAARHLGRQPNLTI